MFRVGQFRLYKIDVTTAHCPVSVYRRYRDFEWLYTILCLKYPACIIPPIPPKHTLGNWYGDESEQVQKRKKGLEKFLWRVMQHRVMGDSPDIKSFATEADHAWEDRKRGQQMYIIENTD